MNAAFQVERFFKVGDRTNVDEIRTRMESGAFLVMDGTPSQATRGCVACVYVERRGTDAYLGMLDVSPSEQGQGLGRRLIGEAEAYGRSLGCRAAIITVVNLREDLLPLYARWGYHTEGHAPFPDDGSASRPCHFVVMRKPLVDAVGS